MKNKLFLILIMCVFSGCQNAKDGFIGTKKNNSDEFLVKKKSLLVLPPDYEKLPEPGNEDEIEERNIKDIIITDSNQSIQKKTNNKSIEDFIINQIKKNGFVKLDRFLAKKTTQQLKDLVNFNYKKYTGKEFTGTPDRVTDDKMVYNLQNKNYTFIKLITSRNVVEIAKYFLNDPYYRFIDNKYPNYNLLYFNARSSGKKLDLHIEIMTLLMI